MGRVWGKRNKRKAWPVICEALSVLAPFPQAAFFLTSVPPQHKLFENKWKRLQCRLALVVWYLTGFFSFSEIPFSDQKDPFNRSPLTMEMVQPDQELKEKIETWLKEWHQKSV